MIDDEVSKILKKPPVVEYEIPKHIFVTSNDETFAPANLITRLWIAA